MRIIKPSYEYITQIDADAINKLIETCGRVCYKSEDRITPDSAEAFMKMLIDIGHESVLEHYSFTVKFICDRGVSHEIVRHRIAAYSQESTRYCNYAKGKFNSEITVIEPCFLTPGTEGYTIWREACIRSESAYFNLLDWGCTPQEARDVLPVSLKTEVVTTYNLREWRHFLTLRCSKAAHPQMREITIPLLLDLKRKLPLIFGDIKYYDGGELDECIEPV